MIPIGSDHAGYELKQAIITHFIGQLSFEDFGTHSSDSTDYPDYAHAVAQRVGDPEHPLGILICGSANGVAMTANKHVHIRAAICWSTQIAELARMHNDANILCIPARFVTSDEAMKIVDIFIKTQFEGGRHACRVDKISKMI